jgi:hypothetical protein
VRGFNYQIIATGKASKDTVQHVAENLAELLAAVEP